MNTRPIRGSAFLALMLVSVSGACKAQDPRTPATTAECDAAIAAIDKLVAKPHQPDASEQQQLWTATRCGARGGGALAQLVPLSRASTDVAGFSNAEALATNLSDSSIAHAALQLAADGAASAESRIFALRVVMRLKAPASWVDQASSYSLAGTSCRTHTLAAPDPLPGAPLPSDFAVRAGTLAKALAGSSSPANVRAMATCAYRLFGAFANLDVDATKISLSYVCGNDFRVQNGNASVAPLKYRVVGKNDEGDINAPANASLTFRTDSIGTVNLYLDLPVVPNDPQPIRSAANGDAKCGS